MVKWTDLLPNLRKKIVPILTSLNSQDSWLSLTIYSYSHTTVLWLIGTNCQTIAVRCHSSYVMALCRTRNIWIKVKVDELVYYAQIVAFNACLTYNLTEVLGQVESLKSKLVLLTNYWKLCKQYKTVPYLL